MDMELITKDTNTFDNLSNRPDKPTSQEISDLIYPIPSGVNDNAGCPTGMVGTFFGLTAPAGWLVCDGTKYNKTDYPSLFAHLSTFSAERRAEWGNADWVDEFNVPNLLGEFPRFSGTNGHSGQGSGGAVGVHQNATEIPFFGYEAAGNVLFMKKRSTSTNNTIISGDASVMDSDNVPYMRIAATASAASADKSTRVSVRSTNTSFLPIIKY